MHHKRPDLKIGIIDCNTLFSNTLSGDLNNTPGLQVIMEAGTGNESLAQLKQLSDHPDLILIEPQTPKGSMPTLELVEQLTTHYPLIKLIILTAEFHVHIAARLSHLGCSA